MDVYSMIALAYIFQHVLIGYKRLYLYILRTPYLHLQHLPTP